MVTLRTPIRSLPRMRSDVAEKFESLGLETLHDALLHFPIRHQDWRTVVPIDQIETDQSVTVLGTIVSVKGRKAWKRKMHLTEVVVSDESGAALSVVWFNQPYLASWLKPKQQWWLSGKVSLKKKSLQMLNPMYQRPGAQPAHETLVPVYPATAGLSQWQIRKVLKLAVPLASLIPDSLPADIQTAHGLVNLRAALQEIHFPSSFERAEAALRRLKFNELLAWQLRWRLTQLQAGSQPAPTIPFHEQAIRDFVATLPFQLTNDQRMVAWEIFQDLGKPKQMSRLVQGDVGSGKTVVAALASYLVSRNRLQVALLAPTVVLAEQHWKSLLSFFEGTEIKLGLLTGSRRATSEAATTTRPAMLKQLADGAISILVSTHAALQTDIQWHRLGLVIVDEQQRFGVQQRRLLLDQGKTGRSIPHFLSLTATPIPRTLGLFLAGELAISTLKNKPPGRTPISSRVLGPDDRTAVDQTVKETLATGQQVYVITPLIEESDAFGVRAATTEFERLKKAFPHNHLGLVHGSLSENERISVLRDFRDHKLDLLVSTTVIEVGIDVPNATLMVIEGSERFGLAQLHQLRGRVGRGKLASTCLFVTDESSTAIIKRLKQVASTDDGFALAELDLKKRGVGDLYGVRQSGLPDWRLANLQDTELMGTAQEVAGMLVDSDRDLAEQLAAASPAYHRE